MPTVDPSRGKVLGAGGVLLAAAVGLLQARLEVPWSNGVHFIVALAAFVLVFGVAQLSPLPERPLAYQSTLALSGLALLTFVLFRLAQVFGVDQPFGNSGTVMWMTALFALVAAYAAMRYHSLACGLLAGLAAAGFVLTFVDKVFNPSGIDTFRWILFLLVLGFTAGAAYLRQGPRPGLATQAVDLAGLMLIGIAATFLAAAAVSSLRPFGGSTASLSAGFGWKAVMILGSLAVIAYAAVERERGP